MELTVHHRAQGRYVGNVEHVRVRAARKANSKNFPHRGVRAVATSDVLGFTRFLGAVRAPQTSENAIATFLKVQEFGRPFNQNASLRESFTEQLFMFILRID
jgi:hypothetical protein